MTTRDSRAPQATRRGFLSGGAGLAALAGAGLGADPAQALDAQKADAAREVEPFWGPIRAASLRPRSRTPMSRRST